MLLFFMGARFVDFVTFSLAVRVHLAVNGASAAALYSQTVVRQFQYVRRSYDIDTTSVAIREAPRTYDWRKYECRCREPRQSCLLCPSYFLSLVTPLNFES